MTPDDLLPTLVYPLVAGLAVGFVVGLITGILATLNWITRRRERGQAVPIYTEESNPRPGRTPWRGREHLSRLGWVLVALGLVGIVLGSFSLYRNTATQNCLREYIQQSSSINQQRAASGDIDRQGIRQQRDAFIEFNQTLIDAVTHPVTDPAVVAQRREEFIARANDWNVRLAEVKRLDQEAEAKRQQNPLPAPPDC